MKISPIDIQQQQFKTRPFGYEKAGVDRFLELLAEELERLIRRTQDLQEELARTNASLAEMREREETLKKTLVTTQRITEELKSTARREVDLMMAEAEIKAERLMHNAEERRLQLIEELQEIKRQKIDFEVGLRGLLEKHIRMLDLNTVPLAQQGEDARLLEEPLPFAGGPEPEAAEQCHGDDAPQPSVEEAEFVESPDPVDTPHDHDGRRGAIRRTGLSFDFDPGDEEDLLK